MPSQLSTAKSIIARGIFDGLRSFSELEERISALGEENTKVLGDAFEIFIEGYLATQPKFLADQNWVVGQVPLPVREQMNLPNDSKGIDGIFRTNTGTLVPYQVKFRSKRAYLTYTEVAPFLGLTERATDRIIFTNSDEVALDAKNRDAMRSVRGIDFDELTPEDFEVIAGWLKEKPVAVSKPKPRDYQEEALGKICSVLAENDRATAVMACGTGKTLLALWVAERLQPKTVVVLLPSLTLVQQTLDEWSRHNSWGSRFSYICVCSDKTVVGTDTIEIDNMDVEFPVSTDPAQVRAFLASTQDHVKVVFSTYQSSRIVSEGAEGLAPFDLGIFDEAHKTTGPKGGLFAHSLSDENVRINKRLFMTATPRHYDIRRRDQEGDFKVISMDDESVYGPRAYTLTFGEAAKRGIICDYKVVISVVDGAEINQFALEHGITLVEGDQIGAKWVASQLAIERAVEKTSAKRAITFHSRVAMAKDFGSDTTRGIQQFLDGFTSFHVNGKQRSSERKQVIKAFRDAPKAIITNARCLTEGIDIPAVDMVAFIDPRRSKVDIAQAAGRAMRKPRGSDKTHGYIVIPLFLEKDSDETLNDALKRSDFSDVAEVLNAMREQDDDLVEVIQSLTEAKGRGEVFDPKALEEKIEVLGPDLELASLAAGIFAEIVDSLGISWDEWFGRLQSYKQFHGDCLVLQRFETDDGNRLGGWVSKQRHKQYSLSADRRRRMDEIGFVWDPHDQLWETGLRELQSYKLTSGDCLVADTFTTDNGFALGTWVGRQRRISDSLSADRRRRMDEIGFVWDPLDQLWETGFRELQIYKKVFGNCLVPIGFKTNSDYRLGRWLSVQRGNRHKLTRNRCKRLDEIGMVWEPLVVQWEAGFNALKSYKQSHGDCLVHRSLETDDGFKLGAWVTKQRYKRNELSEDRVSRLETIGFVWYDTEASWDLGFQALQSYKQSHGDCLVPRNFQTSDGFQLGNWTGVQRRNRDKLRDDRFRHLESIGFVWDTLTARWELGFQALQSYKQAYGNCLVPQSFETNDGLNLGHWVSTQRQRKTSLTGDRFERLEKIGFIWQVQNESWETAFEALVSYKLTHGDCMIPKNFQTEDGYRLGGWVNRLRAKRSDLSEDQLEALEKIGFVWNALKWRWEAGYEAMKSYKHEHGDCLVPTAFKTADGYSLGKWVGVQRTSKDKMPTERRQRLEDIGFVWDPFTAAWKAGLAALQDYKHEHGDCLVPRAFKTADGYSLGQWVGVQRTSKDKMPAERRQRLDDIGFVWAAGETD